MLFSLFVASIFAKLNDITTCTDKVEGSSESIDVRGCGNIEIINCRWENKLALYFESGTGKVIMRDSTVKSFVFQPGNDCPVYVDAQGFEMRNCVITQMTSGADRRDILSYKCTAKKPEFGPVFESCSFTDNVNAYFFMLIPSLPCTFKKCTWSGNTCNQSFTSGIFVTGDIGEAGDIQLIECTFDRNTADYGAGAVHVSQNTHDETLIEKCTFTNNQCKYQGGAVDAQMSTIFRGCTFQNNSVVGDIFQPRKLFGGDVYIEVGTNGTITYQIDSCTFIAGVNQVNSGGAVYILHHYSESELKNKVQITGSSFTSYWAIDQGGAVGSGYEIEKGGDGNGDLDILHCTFKNCSAPKGGAVVFENGDKIHDQNAYVNNCTFDNCRGTEGGAIWTKAYTFEMVDSTIMNSERLAGKDVVSYFLYLAADENEEKCTPKVSHCKFIGNRFSGIFVDIAAPLGITFDVCYFEDNCHIERGGAIDTAGWIAEYATFNNCTFKANGDPGSITRQGGAMHINGSTNTLKKLTVFGCAFHSNKAYEDGGSVYITDMEVTFDSCEFFSNDAQTSAAKGNHVYLVLNKNCEFRNCQFSDHDHSNSGFEVIGESDNHVLTFSGEFGCFHGENAEHAPLLHVDTKGTVKFTGKACFQPSKKDEAIQVVRGNLVGWNDEWLGCAECAPLPKPTPTPGPTEQPQPSESGKGGKLSGGAIAGISIFVIVVIAAIVVVVLWVLKRRNILDPTSFFKKSRFYTTDVDLESQLVGSGSQANV